MVKTRSQQKITFPSRKPKSLSKSDVKSDDTSHSYSKACCISTLSRVCYREKVKDVESFDERFQVESSSAKKMLSGDIFEEQAMFPVTPRRTRRALSYEDDAENDQSQAVPTRRSEPCNRSNELFKSSSRSKSQKMPSLKAAVNSPQKNDVSQRGSPLECSSGLEHTGRSIFGRRNNAQFTNRIGKRRHSSTFDNETPSLANHLPNKRAINEHRPLSKSLSSPSLEKQRELHNPSTSGMENVTPNRQLLCVGTRDGHFYKETKHVLHSSIPDSLLCRDTERKYIESFLKSHLVHKKPGSLYISGAPGTGKTACLTHILEQLQKNGLECQVQFINCMNLSKSHRIYSKITEELTGWDKLTNKEAQKFLEKKFTTKGSPIVLILDEIDQLESKNQDVLYTMFEWPSLPSSSLILIGIANALDLTDRVLPRLQLRTECKPKLLHFSPYSKDQIAKILTARLSEVKGSSIVDVSAVQFCARKIAAVSGDMRKALDICRRAVEIVECEVRRQQVLKPIEQGKLNRDDCVLGEYLHLTNRGHHHSKSDIKEISLQL